MSAALVIKDHFNPPLFFSSTEFGAQRLSCNILHLTSKNKNSVPFCAVVSQLWGSIYTLMLAWKENFSLKNILQ